jgi:hypothetical protein
MAHPNYHRPDVYCEQVSICLDLFYALLPTIKHCLGRLHLSANEMYIQIQTRVTQPDGKVRHKCCRGGLAQETMDNIR